MPFLFKDTVSAKAGSTAGEGRPYKKTNPALVKSLGCLQKTCGILPVGNLTPIPSCRGFQLRVFKTEIIFKCVKTATKQGFKRSRTWKIPSNVCVYVTSHVHPQRLDANYWKLTDSLWLKIFPLALLLTLQKSYFPFKYL